MATVTVTNTLLSDTDLSDSLVDTVVYTVTYTYQNMPNATIESKTIATFYVPVNWYEYETRITSDYSKLEEFAKKVEESWEIIR